MDISAISHQTSPMKLQEAVMSKSAIGKNASKEDAKIADSCKQFEAIMWRQMLDKALEPMLQGATGNADKSGMYNFFLTNTISESISGGKNGIASVLQAQMIKHPKPNS
jgi:Rod binding domain-containing protein